MSSDESLDQRQKSQESELQITNDANQNIVKRRKKHVLFVDDDDGMMVVKKHRHKKPKFMDKNLNQKELLESVLFESDESSGNELEKSNKEKDSQQSTAQEKNHNDFNKEDHVDHYSKNILENINFSDSDDLDDFIERDDGINTEKFPKINDFQTLSNRARNDTNDSHLDSYRLAVEVFGEDFNANDFDFTKPFAVEEDEYQNEVVSDDLGNEDYSGDYLNNVRVTNHHNTIKKSIHELFEPEEIKRQYLTNTDEDIRMKDIPERFQIRLNPVLSATNDELANEANWIYENFFDKKSLLLTNEKRLVNSNSAVDSHPLEHIKYIKATLNLIRNELCEVPFILTYRHENINGVFTEDELWTIYRADSRWMSFSKQLNDFYNYLNQMKKFQNHTKNSHINFYYKISDRDIDYIKNIKSEQEFFDFYKKIHLYNDDYKAEFINFYNQLNLNDNTIDNMTDNFHKDPTMFNRHHYYITKGVGKVTKCFGLKSSDFDENVRVQYRKYTLEVPEHSPEQIAANNISSYYDTKEKVLEAAVEMYVMEIANEQHIRKYVRQMFANNARLNVSPTKKGNDEIDETHPYSSFKYILNKPLKTITSEMFIKLNEAKREGLVQIEICILESVKTEILENLKSYQSVSASEESIYMKEWNDLYFKATEKAVLDYIIPSLNRELFQKLSNEAHDDLIIRCAKVFKTHLIASPFSHELEKLRLDTAADFGESESPCILIVNVPPVNYNKTSNKIQKHQMKAFRGNINHYSMNVKLNEIENNEEFTVGNEIDEIGYAIVMNSDFELVEQAMINNCILKKSNNDSDSGLRFSELSLKKIDKLVNKYNISDVFVPLMSQEYSNLAHRIEKRLVSMEMSIQPQVHLVNPYISNNIVKMMSATHSSPLKTEFERSVSLARYVIDPLVECAHLFTNDVELEYLGDLFSPYQKMLNKEKLRCAFEEKIVSMVNEVGLDLNKTCIMPQYSQLLQYVCGMGPRKAIKMMNDMRAHTDLAKLNNRTQLVTVCNLGPKVFINSSGFLKIVGSIDEEGDIDFLDATRIHPELYDWTRKIMVDALEIEDTNTNLDLAKKYDYNDLLETLRNDSSKLKDLDLDAFADELMKNGVPINKKYSLELISTEMLNEFPDYRPRFSPLSCNEKFWILTNGGSRTDLSDTLEYATLASKNQVNLSRFHNEDLIPIYVGKLVSFVVTNFIFKRPDREDITKAVPGKDEETQLWKCPYCLELISHDLKKCWTHIENLCPGRAVGVRGFVDGLFSSIYGVVTISNISDNPPNNIKERVRKGMHLTCQVLSINFERHSVELTCRSSDLLDKGNRCYKYKRDTHFDLEAEEEQRRILRKKADKIKNQVVYFKKIIIHPSFKNVSFSDAENLLKNSDIGECIIRPSSKGTDHLTVTWKVYDNIYQHIDVIEHDKPNQFSVGKKLWIKSECYEDLDEIIARHISPMVALVKEVVGLKVFKLADGGSRHKIAGFLSEEKKGNPLRIPYILAPCKIYPGKFLLGFLPRTTPIFEYVSVTPDGIKFRDVVHKSVEEMIVWFKKNFTQSNNNNYKPISKTPLNNISSFVSSPSSNFSKYGNGSELPSSNSTRKTPNQDFSYGAYKKSAI